MELKTCAWCGEEFMAKTSRARFCSQHCSYKYRYNHDPEYRQGFIDRGAQRIKENPEARKVARAAYTRWRMNNPEAARSSAKRWVLANKERVVQNKRNWYAAHPEKQREYSRNWRRDNPDRSRIFDKVKTAKRLAAKFGNGGSFTSDEFLDLCDRYEWKCAYCGCSLIPSTVSADHVIPLSRGGSSNIDNIAPACRSCNSRKHDKTAEEYDIWLKEGQGVMSY